MQGSNGKLCILVIFVECIMVLLKQAMSRTFFGFYLADSWEPHMWLTIFYSRGHRWGSCCSLFDYSMSSSNAMPASSLGLVRKRTVHVCRIITFILYDVCHPRPAQKKCICLSDLFIRNQGNPYSEKSKEAGDGYMPRGLCTLTQRSCTSARGHQWH